MATDSTTIPLMTGHEQSVSTSRRPEAQEPISLYQWTSVGATCFSALSVIVMTVIGWLGVDAALTRSRESNARQHAFNHELVAAIANLANQTGVLASEQHCPVRFRMRYPDASRPARPVHGNLERVPRDDNAYQFRTFATTTGVLDFGLQSPGRYRLSLMTMDGMTLEHEFDVIPEAPVDRVVICPRGTPPANVPTSVRLVVNWPPQLSDEHLLAVIDIAPGPFESGEWRWEQDAEWPLRAVAAVKPGDDSPAIIARDLNINNSFSHGPPLKIHAADAVPVPYRFCQLRAITFFQRPPDDSSSRRWRLLGTLAYGDTQHPAPPALLHAEATESPPLYEVRHSFHENTWSIEIPQDCIATLLQRIQDIQRTSDSET